MNKFKVKFGTLYENLNLNQGRLVILEPVTFFARRLLLAYICMFSESLTY